MLILEWAKILLWCVELGLNIIPSCGGDSSIHASQYKQYKIYWHLYSLTMERLQHKFSLVVPR